MMLNFVLTILSVSQILLASPITYELTILHNNDLHSTFDEFKGEGFRCKPKHAKQNKCYGGMPRLLTKLKEIRCRNRNTITLNAGDTYYGSDFFTFLQDKPVCKFSNMMNYTAMSLGNHEFDNKVIGLKPFVRCSNSPIVAANVDFKNYPELESKISKSIVRNIGGKNIGIIGYLTEDTVRVSKVDSDVIFHDVVNSVAKEAKRLANEENIKHIIAVGHAGIDMDINLCKSVPELDVVVGGHSDTFLYDGEAEKGPKIDGPYPTVIKKDRNSPCLVVQDYRIGKYLGYLNVKFDAQGNVWNYSGNPILLDHTVAKDPVASEAVKKFKDEIEIMKKDVVGSSDIFLNGQKNKCRTKECEIGDLLGDAAVFFFKASLLKNTHQIYSIINGGAITASIDKGNITNGDIKTALSRGNELKTATLNGKQLRDFFELSVINYDPKEPSGKFLQVSGFRVIYKISNSDNNRVVKLCAKNKDGAYELVSDQKTYKIAIPDFLLGGGDDYTFLKEVTVNQNTAGIDNQILTEYIRKFTPITEIKDERIRFLNAEDQIPDCSFEQCD